MISRLLLWLVMDSPSWLLPQCLAPWVLGLVLGSRPHRVEKDK